MNSWWEWSVLNWIIPFRIIYLTKQSLKRPARFRMGAQEEKAKKEIPPVMCGWRRGGRWSGLCSCRLLSQQGGARQPSTELSSVAVLPLPALPAALQVMLGVVMLVSCVPAMHTLANCAPTLLCGEITLMWESRVWGPSVHVSNKFTVLYFPVIRAELCQFMFSKSSLNSV